MSGALKNEDFRRMLMTPRASAATDAPATSGNAPSFTHKRHSTDSMPALKSGGEGGKAKKKHFRPKPRSAGGKDVSHKRNEEETELSRVLSTYRDRAKERREGERTVGGPEVEIEMLKMSSSLHAVAPVGSLFETEAQRKQKIEESKYLGGDMEHTHLVKGLDYALLQKVRSELVQKEHEEDVLESLYQQTGRQQQAENVKQEINNPMVKRLHDMLFGDGKNAKVEEERAQYNELFAPKRMAYVVDLSEGVDLSVIDSDIPTTLLRSKADCPLDEATASLSVNDVVINKLSQVLGYLRADNKRKKAEKGKLIAAAAGIGEEEPKTAEASTKSKSTKEQRDKDLDGAKNMDIFDEVGEYKPPRPSKDTHSSRDRDRRDRDDDRRSDRRRDERRRDGRDDRYRDDRRRIDRDRERERGDRRSEQSDSRAKGNSVPDKKSKVVEESSIPEPNTTDVATVKAAKQRLAGEIDSYAECYPQGIEEMAGFDSDDEVDFNKMDKGKRRGVGLNRWDFDNEEEFERYQSQREALPKAAYQYGVKLKSGRQTRKTGGGGKPKDDSKKLDREWSQISKMITKRKDGGGINPEVAAKLAKY